VIRAGAWVSRLSSSPGRFDDLNYEIDHARPVLLGLVRKDGATSWSHYVVLVGHDRGGARWLVADPDTGWRVVTQKDLARELGCVSQVMLAIFPPAVPPLRAALRFVAFRKCQWNRQVVRVPMDLTGAFMWKTDALRPSPGVHGQKFARQKMIVGA